MIEPFSLILFCILKKAGLFTNALLNSGAEIKPEGLAFITKMSLWVNGLGKPH